MGSPSPSPPVTLACPYVFAVPERGMNLMPSSKSGPPIAAVTYLLQAFDIIGTASRSPGLPLHHSETPQKDLAMLGQASYSCCSPPRRVPEIASVSPVESQVIPQLIARIDTPRPLVGRLIHQLLTDIGRYHPQVCWPQMGFF